MVEPHPDVMFVLQHREDYLVEFYEPLPALDERGSHYTARRRVTMTVDHAIGTNRFNAEGRASGVYPDDDHLRDFLVIHHARLIPK